ncbi:MAG: 23S rRNA (uracil(1939)-C(5))-methyltransferase RlmD [Planctomycetota bacterium]
MYEPTASASGPTPGSAEGATPGPGATPAVARRPRRGDRFQLRIESIDERGKGVASREGALGDVERFLLRNANPGALVEAEVLSRKGRKIDARVAGVVEPGPFAAPSRCPHAGVCGGCALPTLDYAEQLRQKRGIVERALSVAWSAAGLGPIPDVEDVVPATELEGYRNKMDFTFGSRRYVLAEEPEGVDASFGLGLHAPGLHHKVLDVRSCAIAFDGASDIVNHLRRAARERGLAPWDQKVHEGLLRHLVLRRGARTGETMVDLVTSERAADLVDPLVEELLGAFPSLTTVVQNTTTRLSQVAFGEKEHVLHGPGTIDEVLCGKRFRISADSFFQTNTAQAERLFEMVAEEAAVQPGERLFDVYCGAGTIGISIAPEDVELVGFESAPSAVRDAQLNAEVNGASNAMFHEGDVLHTLSAESARRAPDVLVVDPPRAGLHPKVPAALAALGAPRIVLVSCNPKTGARDLALLLEEGYSLRSARPIDLFPHTPHVEVVFGLERRR